MITHPLTFEQAKNHRYGTWGGNPRGVAYDKARCAYEVYEHVGRIFCQCGRRNGHGPAELYCKQHAKIIARRLEPST